MSLLGLSDACLLLKPMDETSVIVHSLYSLTIRHMTKVRYKTINGKKNTGKFKYMLTAIVHLKQQNW